MSGPDGFAKNTRVPYLFFEQTLQSQNGNILLTASDGNVTCETITLDGADLKTYIDSHSGAQGPSGTISVGTTSSVPYGSAASVTNSGTNTAAIFDFVLQAGPPGESITGEQGDKGDTGDAATITIGDVSAVPYGTAPNVINSGNEHDAILDFTLTTGQQGIQGVQGVAGNAATVSVGAVYTVPYGDGCNVVNVGTTSNAVLNFYIQSGRNGTNGHDGHDGEDSTVPGPRGPEGPPGPSGGSVDLLALLGTLGLAIISAAEFAALQSEVSALAAQIGVIDIALTDLETTVSMLVTKTQFMAANSLTGTRFTSSVYIDDEESVPRISLYRDGSLVCVDMEAESGNIGMLTADTGNIDTVNSTNLNATTATFTTTNSSNVNCNGELTVDNGAPLLSTTITTLTGFINLDGYVRSYTSLGASGFNQWL